MLATIALINSLTAVTADEIPDGSAGYRSAVQPFFQTYCIRCHGPEKRKGRVTLQTLAGDFSKSPDLERWEKILDVLDAGVMPPSSEPQPKPELRQAVATWIERGLRGAVDDDWGESPAPMARRLTNAEYQHTMRDLLGFELQLADRLPEDPEKPYRFNNTAEFMLFGPEQFDRYLDNARRAMASAIVDPEPPEVHRQEWDFTPRQPAFADSPVDEVGIYGGRRGSVARGVTINRWPETGEYRIRIQAGAILPPGYDEVPLRLVMGSTLRSDAGTGDFAPVGTAFLRNDVDHLQEFTFSGRIENHPTQVGKVTANGQQPPTLHLYPQNLFDNGQLNDHRTSHFDSSWAFDVPRAVVRSITFEAPVVDTWPPEHHTRILFDSPLRTTDPPAHVRTVLERFLSRAFRRSVTPLELDRFVRLYEMLEPELGSLEATMRETLAMALVSPQFLYHSNADDGPTTPHDALASRLSYFLWGSMPDAELLLLAARRELADPRVMEAQVRRLLADPRSDDFVEQFTVQWLSIAKAKAVNINRKLFPRFLFTVPNGERRGQEVLFRPTIRDYMQEETVGFVAELIRRNASVLELVDSDFAVLNEPLAAHYGVEGVQGLQLRPVPIEPRHHLGGLLTQGSVLVGNATGSAPHPIYRGVWLREAILGDEVEPPPADVPALTDTAGEVAEEAITIKDLLRRHRQQESCNDCHARLDPWGIPFERYNAVGRYQPLVPEAGVTVDRFLRDRHQDLAGYQAYLETIQTVKVDARAQVPDGPDIEGMRELKEYLLRNRADDVAENVIRRLLTYALGRPLTPHDRFTVETLRDAARHEGYAFADLIVSICQHERFTCLARPTRSP